jgi:hypothetical protein
MKDNKCNRKLVNEFKNYQKKRQNMVFLNKNDYNEKFDNVETWTIDAESYDVECVEDTEDAKDTKDGMEDGEYSINNNTYTGEGIKKLIIISNRLILSNKDININKSSTDYG